MFETVCGIQWKTNGTPTHLTEASTIKLLVLPVITGQIPKVEEANDKDAASGRTRPRPLPQHHVSPDADADAADGAGGERPRLSAARLQRAGVQRQGRRAAGGTQCGGGADAVRAARLLPRHLHVHADRSHDLDRVPLVGLRGAGLLCVRLVGLRPLLAGVRALLDAACPQRALRAGRRRRPEAWLVRTPTGPTRPAGPAALLKTTGGSDSALWRGHLVSSEINSP